MPQIAPLCGLRYNPDRFAGEFSKLIAPPYDVLSAQDKAALLAQHDRNIVRVDLPHVPPKNAGPDELYAQAADVLQQWIEDNTLIREDRPALYVYHQEYTHAGRAFTRKKLFARMKLEPFGTGTVFPHEHTFGGPKADRLKLMQATRCQLSAVFGLFSDPDGSVGRVLAVESQPPDVTAELDGVINRMWVVTDEAAIQTVADLLADKPVYIADGHHRYGTAINYLDSLPGAADLPPDHPARFILIGLCAMEDPGAVILPTHRVLSGFGEMPPSEVLASLRQGLDLVKADHRNLAPDDLLPAGSPHDLAVYVASEDQFYLGRFTRRNTLASLAPDQSPAWRQLDLAYLHSYLIDELITRQVLGGADPVIQYLKAADQAITAARQCNGLALICKPCTMAQLKAVSDAGDLMPQKSTYFYPKLATGLVINPLE